MPAPTNPKKQSLMPSTLLRSKLRGVGHGLDAVVQLGKEGTTEAVKKQVNQALTDHELVKVKIGQECPQDRFEVAAWLAAEPGTSVVQILGRIVLVYRRDPDKSRYEGGGAAKRSGAKPVGAKDGGAKGGGTNGGGTNGGGRRGQRRGARRRAGR
jgi:RNA-binding protein